MQRMIKWVAVIFAITLVFTLTTPIVAYENHCWKCGEHISSSYCSRCSECGWYICVDCGACRPGCSQSSNHKGNDSSGDYDSNSSSSSSGSYDSYPYSVDEAYPSYEDQYYDDYGEHEYEIYYDDVAVTVTDEDIAKKHQENLTHKKDPWLTAKIASVVIVILFIISAISNR